MNEKAVEMIGRIQYLITLLENRKKFRVPFPGEVKEHHIKSAITALETGRDQLINSLHIHQKCLLDTAQLYSVQLGFVCGNIEGHSDKPAITAGMAARLGLADPVMTMSPGNLTSFISSSYSIEGLDDRPMAALIPLPNPNAQLGGTGI